MFTNLSEIGKNDNVNFGLLYKKLIGTTQFHKFCKIKHTQAQQNLAGSNKKCILMLRINTIKSGYTCSQISLHKCVSNATFSNNESVEVSAIIR